MTNLVHDVQNFSFHIFQDVAVKVYSGYQYGEETLSDCKKEVRDALSNMVII